MSEAAVQERAYRLWERDPSRSAEQNWFLAEAELEAEAAVARAPGPGPQIADGAGAAAGGGVVIQKSPADKRQYRYLKLENGMSCCLISDPPSAGDIDCDCDGNDDGAGSDAPSGQGQGQDGEDEGEDEGDAGDAGDAGDDDGDEGDAIPGNKKAACAISVGVGSFNDTDELQGMAHFVEHMLFMGSKKYPDENEFDAWVGKHGGYTNACTDMEETTYEFDIHRNYLREGLDMFAQFFIDPLMKEGSMAREREAIDSEFTMSEQNDYCRSGQIMASLATKGHPLGRFVWGNEKSLKEIPEAAGTPVRDQLYAFWKEHYSASRMNLCILGKETLDELEAMVRETFSAVPTDGAPARSFGHLVPPWTPETYHQMLKVVPVNDGHTLRLTWQLPSMLDLYRKKPLGYLAELVGHEGPGGILQQLKANHWATGLSAGCAGTGEEINTNYFLFQCSIALTDKGLANAADVAAQVMAYIAMLTAEGPQKRLWDEFRDVAKVGFEFEEESEAMDYCEKIAMDMFDFQPEDTLTGDLLYYEWDPKPIQDTLAMLTVDRVNVMLLSKSFEDECKQTEPWFGGVYCISAIPEAWIATWREAAASVDKALFHLPPPNPFIPTDFGLVEVVTPPTVPRVVHRSLRLLTWHLADETFNKPRAEVYAQLATPKAHSSAFAAAMSALFVQIVDLQMKPHTYAALTAELSYSISIARCGFVLKFSGFSHKIKALITMVLGLMKDFQVDADQLNMVRQQLVRSLKNSRMKPGGVGRHMRLEMLETLCFSVHDRIAMMEAATVESLQAYVRTLWAGVSTTTFVTGNMTVDNAVATSKEIVDTLGTTEILPAAIPIPRTVAMPTGNFCVSLPNANKADNNSYIEVYYQIGGADTREFVLSQFMQDIMQEPLFNELRTNQQLGYSVNCSYRMTHGHLGFLVTCQPQSTKFDLDEVDGRIEKFFDFFEEFLNDMSDADYKNQVEASVAEKLRPDNNLGERTYRYWTEITAHSYQFVRLKQEAAIAQTITKDELIAWFKSTIHPSNPTRRKMAFRVVGHGKVADVTADADPADGEMATVEDVAAAAAADEDAGEDAGEDDGGDDGGDTGAPPEEDGSHYNHGAEFRAIGASASDDAVSGLHFLQPQPGVADPIYGFTRHQELLPPSNNVMAIYDPDSVLSRALIAMADAAAPPASAAANIEFNTPPVAYTTYDDDAALGKPAPAIDPAEYVKGDPITLGGGKVAVVTFFAKFAKGDYTTIVGVNKLAAAFPDVSFVGLSIDPEKADAEGFLKKLGTAMPEIYIDSLDVSYPLAWDNGKAVKEAYRKVAGMMSLGASACFVVDSAGTIVWREQFGQGHAPHQGQLGEQIRRTVAGEELLKNGPKPAEEVEEEEELDMGGADDYDSDLGF